MRERENNIHLIIEIISMLNIWKIPLISNCKVFLFKSFIHIKKLIFLKSSKIFCAFPKLKTTIVNEKLLSFHHNTRKIVLWIMGSAVIEWSKEDWKY